MINVSHVRDGWLARCDSRRRQRALAQSLRWFPIGRNTNRDRKDVRMKYAIGLVLGIPIPILAVWFLVSHC